MIDKFPDNDKFSGAVCSGKDKIIRNKSINRIL